MLLTYTITNNWNLSIILTLQENCKQNDLWLFLHLCKENVNHNLLYLVSLILFLYF